MPRKRSCAGASGSEAGHRSATDPAHSGSARPPAAAGHRGMRATSVRPGGWRHLPRAEGFRDEARAERRKSRPGRCARAAKARSIGRWARIGVRAGGERLQRDRRGRCPRVHPSLRAKGSRPGCRRWRDIVAMPGMPGFAAVQRLPRAMAAPMTDCEADEAEPARQPVGGAPPGRGPLRLALSLIVTHDRARAELRSARRGARLTARDAMAEKMVTRLDARGWPQGLPEAVGLVRPGRLPPPDPGQGRASAPHQGRSWGRPPRPGTRRGGRHGGRTL